MTRDEIVALESGRELDALVAEKVMGWRWVTYTQGGREANGWPLVRFLRPLGISQREDLFYVLADMTEPVGWDDMIHDKFSIDIAAAWQVVEEMGRRGFWCVVKTPFAPAEEDKWGHLQHAGFTPHGFTGWNGRADYRAAHELLPVAICHAALIALAYYPELPPE